MTKHPIPSTAALWARFRFSVVGSLLSSPPARGELKAAIETLASKTWTHPVTGRDVRFAAKTIEEWFYRARREHESASSPCYLRHSGIAAKRKWKVAPSLPSDTLP